ncbi:hypothetical protein [Pseudoclavibacter helvolus]|uniref:Uncharacterized protein n=1 Tax=Pseudoclavibacter helvolus TaxID=255205 RepID=A0A7W4YER3_9MICO|nr:hypothetical protein [Pseudoclavibacter helvolus]MBB2956778.1 hypothetical protein [Pseudoclavibacter helvolus]
MGKRLLWNDKGLMGNGVQNPDIEGDHWVIEEVRLGVVTKKALGPARGRKGEDGANVLPTRTAVENATASLTVSEPADTFGPHHAHLQAAVNDAHARGIKRLRVPPLLASDPSLPWRCEESITLPAGMTVDASDADFRHAPAQPNRPLWYVPEASNSVTVHVRHAYTPAGVPGGPARPTAAEYPAGNVYGAPARAAYSGVLTYASNGHFTGEYSGFRNGARAGILGATRASGNRFDLKVAKVDFGLVYFGQSGMVANVEGSYETTSGSEEPAHLVYGTWHAVSSTDCTVDGKAFDGIGGIAFLHKGSSGLKSNRMEATRCAGVLALSSSRSPANLGDVIGTALTGGYQRPDESWYYTDAVRTEVASEDPGGVDRSAPTATRVIIDLADTIPMGELRAMSLSAGWTIGTASVTYGTNEYSSFVRLIEVYGNASNIGVLQVTNRGTGGVRGIRYATNTKGHVLGSAPVMSGVTNGVTVETGASGVFNVDEALITSTRSVDVPVVMLASRDVVVRGMRNPRRRNRWYSVPNASATEPARTNLNNLHAIPVSFEALTVISDLAVSVITAQPGGSVRLGVYADDAGAPGARLVDAGSVAVTSEGEKTVALAAPLRLVAGDYWLCYVVQGAANVALVGAPGMSMGVPAQTATGALNGATVVVTGVSGALPATFGTLVSSSTTTARVAYRVPS